MLTDEQIEEMMARVRKLELKDRVTRANGKVLEFQQRILGVTPNQGPREPVFQVQVRLIFQCILVVRVGLVFVHLGVEVEEDPAPEGDL